MRCPRRRPGTGGGTQVINPPTSQIRSMASVGFETSGIALGDTIGIGLFNDSADGNWLLLWDLKMHYFPFDSGGATKLMDMGHVQGNLGNALTKGAPLVATNAQIDGSLWFQHNYFDRSDDFLYLPGGNGDYSWNHDWPIAAIPPGWSLVIASDGEPITTIVVNFVWQQVAKV